MDMTVVGGGIAGFLTALTIREMMPAATVRVLTGVNVPTAGAGEPAPTAFLADFAETVGVPVTAWLRDAGATLRTGTRLDGWRADGSSYLQPIDAREARPLQLGTIHPDRPADVAAVHPLDAIAARGRVPLRSPLPGGALTPAVLMNLTPLGDLAVHLDLARSAAFLEDVARSRGVEILAPPVTRVLRGESGNLLSVGLEDGRSIPGDLFFDCTGFQRLLLGQALRTPWISAREALPVARALPFSLPAEAAPSPLTGATALTAGWAWTVPLADRTAGASLYDPAFLDDDAAAAEVAARFPGAVPGAPTSFEAGYYQDVWVGNVIAVGDAAGFVEPLAATALAHPILLLRDLLQVYLPLNDDAARADLNRVHRTFWARTIAFLHAHYLTDRADTPFWATFRERTTRPPLLADLLRGGRLRWLFEDPPELAGHPAPFRATAWNRLALGTGLASRDAHDAYWRYFRLYDGAEARLRDAASRAEAEAAACVRHGELLRALRA